MVAAAVAKTAKSPSKKVVKPASHPTFAAMITAALKAMNDKKGSSKQAILKYILANYKVGDNVVLVNSRLRTALKSGLKKGQFRHTKATSVGSNGCFKLGDAAKPKKVVKAKKPKSPKKKTATKKASPKKAATKKTVKKSPKKAATKPKVAKKATKSPKKAKSPKKVVKKTTTKKAVKA